jgi:hypothetical protein
MFAAATASIAAAPAAPAAAAAPTSENATALDHEQSCGCYFILLAAAAAAAAAGVSLPPLIDQLLKLYSLHQPLLSRHTSDVLAALFSSSSSHISSSQQQQLLLLLVDGEAARLMAGEAEFATAGMCYVMTGCCHWLRLSSFTASPYMCSGIQSENSQALAFSPDNITSPKRT